MPTGAWPRPCLPYRRSPHAGSLSPVRQVLLWSVVLFVTWAVLLTLAWVALRWRLQRANRVSPALKSPAPVHWLWLPTHPARLHRRLQGAAGDIHLAPSRRRRETTNLSVDDLRRELEHQAVELDHHLVVAARYPRSHRRELLRQLEGQVAEVERLSVRLSRLSRPYGTPASGWSGEAGPPEVLERISHQLDLLDEAQGELAEIERAAGLVDLDRVMGPTRRPVRDPAPARSREATDRPTDH
jgi:hypothetical protein